MIIGKVIGLVRTIQRLDELPEGPLCLVRVRDRRVGRIRPPPPPPPPPPPEDVVERIREYREIVAFDPIGCGIDQDVLIMEGPFAQGVFHDVHGVADAVIVAIVTNDSISDNRAIFALDDSLLP